MKTEVTSVTTRPHPISNLSHLIMTICTGGLWIPIWIFMARGHKVTTRAPATAAPGGERWNGQRLDPEYMAGHVPGSAEYKARHSEDPEITEAVSDFYSEAHARHAEIKRRNGT